LDVNTTPVDSSSTAPLEVPRDAKAYAEWRQTGKTPDAIKPAGAPRTPKEASAPSTETSAVADDGTEIDSPASEAGTQQEPRKRSNAETRLKDLLDDLKRAGLSPAELKTFKREAQKAEATGTEPPKPPETTVNAENGPVQPKLEDFESYEQFQEAMVDYRVDKKLHERDQRAKAAEQQKEIDKTLEAARARYGDATDTTIGSTAKAVFSDQKIPSALKAIINDSTVMVDLLYTLGSKDAELQEFLDLAKSNPGQAIRKVVLLERLVSEELAGGASAAAGTEAGRDESGKFVSPKAPAKKVTDAPPPPREASGRSAAPPDEIQSALKANDFRSFKNAADRRDLAARQGK
jgi:hypothetical protein